MAIIPNRPFKETEICKDGKRKKGEGATDTLQAYIDTPNFQYSTWLNKSGGINAPIATVNNASNKSVCIIGGGAAGYVAAFELAKCGFDVTMIQSPDQGGMPDDVIGGRLYSYPFPGSANDIAEMGAMRFPLTEEALHYYADAFGIAFEQTGFQDPGVYNTLVNYKGNAQTWNSIAGKAPAGFGTVYNGWVALATYGVKNNGVQQFGEPRNVWRYLSNTLTPGNTMAAQTIWQNYLTEFGQDSFYSGLNKIFGPDHKWDVPGGTVWSAEDFTKFGALGIGSGGFGPLYSIGFTYMFRLIMNQLETNQQGIAGGISQLCQAFRTKLDTMDNFTYIPGTVVKVEAPQTNNPYPRVTYNIGGQDVVKGFNRAIVAISTRAMEMNLSLSNAEPQQPQNAQVTHTNVGEAISRTHVISSSKLFLRTDRFWRDTKYPRVLLSDTKLPQLYTLDYNDPSGSGVVLISYTWEDDSIKTQAFDTVKSRLDMLKEQIAYLVKDTAYSDFADKLVPFNNLPLSDTTKMIDWQDEDGFNGAFTLARPGQDSYVDAMFRDFAKAGTYSDNYIYLATDDLSWTGGWVEGALATGLCATSAVIHSFDGVFVDKDNPMTKIAPGYGYNYYS